MNGTEWVVWLWLMPVTVFIFIPLFMFVVYCMVKLSSQIFGFMIRPMSAIDHPALKPGQSAK